jgi:UDP-glucuronate 4-epimerase
MKLKKNILVTGSAGFIGFHTAKKLLDKGHEVVGIDNLNDYYSVKLKKQRLSILNQYENFSFEKISIENEKKLNTCFDNTPFDYVINLAAQAGVRYSITSPKTYVKSNVEGFLNVLENCRNHKIKHLVYASTSSVYGLNTRLPFKEESSVDHPAQFYAATKRANELMAHSYSNLFNIPTTGLRFFTVYGPWGRPDMALFIFVKNILEGRPIDLFNEGNHTRDFTYVDDIVNGIVKVLDKPAKKDKKWKSNSPNPDSSSAPFRIYNIGNSNPTKLKDFIKEIEKNLKIKAKVNIKKMQLGDIEKTSADVSSLGKFVNYKPTINYKEGIRLFVEWYLNHYKNDK